MKLFLPRAKYMDSIIIKEGEEFVEILLDEVRGLIVDGKLAWVYYPKGKSGQADIITESEILMNLTTGKIYSEEIGENDFIKI